MTLAPYSQTFHCPKCGHDAKISSLRVIWCVGPCPMDREGQHLHVKCFCGYEVATETEDARERRPFFLGRGISQAAFLKMGFRPAEGEPGMPERRRT